MAWDEVLWHLWSSTFLLFACFEGSFRLSGLQLSFFHKGPLSFVSVAMGGDRS